jgi:hypothetical protein
MELTYYVYMETCQYARIFSCSDDRDVYTRRM